MYAPRFKSLLLSLLFLLSLFPAAAQSEARLLVWQDSLYGLINGNGQTVLPCAYEDLTLCHQYRDHEGCIVAKRGGLWGILDWNGQVMVPFRYTAEPEPIPYDNAAGLFLIPSKDHGGVVNTKGDTVVPFRDFNIVPFGINEFNHSYHYGKIFSAPLLITFRCEALDSPLPNGRSHCQYRWGCMDLKGNEVLPLIYKKIDFEHSTIIVEDTNGMYGVMDYSARWICPLTSQYKYFGQGTYVCMLGQQSGLQGLMKSDGTVLLPALYKDIFLDYACAFLKDTSDLWALTDEHFRAITPHCYKELATLGKPAPRPLYLGVRPDGTYDVLDLQGNVIQSFSADCDPYDYPLVYQDGEWRLARLSGELLPQRYKEARQYYSLFSVSTDSLHWGVVDEDGHVVVPFRYTEIAISLFGLIYARRPSGKVDVLSFKGGRKILSCWGVTGELPPLFIANKQGKWAAYDGRRVTRYYEGLSFAGTSNDMDYWAVWDKHGKMGYVDGNGRMIYPCSLETDPEFEYANPYNGFFLPPRETWGEAALYYNRKN